MFHSKPIENKQNPHEQIVQPAQDSQTSESTSPQIKEIKVSSQEKSGGLLSIPTSSITLSSQIAQPEVKSVSVIGASLQTQTKLFSFSSITQLNELKLEELIQQLNSSPPPNKLILVFSDTMSRAEVEESLHCIFAKEMLPVLSELRLQSARLRTLPALPSPFTSLNTLDLSGCKDLEVIREPLQPLKNLSTLILWDCVNLKAIPDFINFSHLSTLNIRNCLTFIDALPTLLNKCDHLQKLELGRCVDLDKVFGMVRPNTLQELYIWDGSALTHLPEWIGELEALKTLYIWEACFIESLPSTIGRLKNLQTLHLWNASNLRTIPAEIGKLAEKLTLFNIWNACNLQYLPTEFGQLINLKTLNLGRLTNFAALPECIGNLINLTSLDISGHKWGDLAHSLLSKLIHLKRLDIRECSYPDVASTLPPHLLKRKEEGQLTVIT